MNIQKKVLAGSLLAFIVVNLAVAEDGAGMKGKMPTFSDFDLDGDGVVTEQEFSEGHAKRAAEMAEQGRKMKGAESCPGFVGIDTDKDGGISAEEFAAHQAEHMQKNKQHGKHEQQ